MTGECRRGAGLPDVGCQIWADLQPRTAKSVGKASALVKAFWKHLIECVSVTNFG